MQPSSKKDDLRLDLFRERLENILNRNHELYRLAGLITWDAQGATTSDPNASRSVQVAAH